MPQTHSAAASGPSRAEPPGGSPHRRPITSPAKSRLTVRLPDLTAPRETPTASGGGFDRQSGSSVSHKVPQTPNPQSVIDAEIEAAEPSGADRSIETLPRKVMAFVRQPKFWLACIVAIAVQVLLAVVMTPAEGDNDQADRRRTAAKHWPKATPEPAARIMVPAAPLPAEALYQTGGAMEGATTPMGLAAPLDSSSDAGPSGTTDSEAGNNPSPSARMADNHRMGGESAQFDGRAVGDVDGATLRGIIPLEPTPDSITNEHRQ